MSRTAASGRVGDLGITKVPWFSGVANSNMAFGHQTFLDGKPYTICARVFVTTSNLTDTGALFAYGYDSGTDKGYVFRLNGDEAAVGNRGRLKIFWGVSTNSFVSSLVLLGTRPRYVFIDFDGSTTGRIWDGTVLKDTFMMAPRTSHATNGVYFGTRDNTARFWTGVIGDGAIYSRLLTDAERARIVQYASYPASAEIQFRADENTGTTITDYSGNGRNGTSTTVTWRNSPFNA